MVWTQITPGTNGTEKTLDIKNAGSVNVSQIYAYVDTESSNPIGKAATSYEAGAFLVMHNSTETTYYFVDRREWNLSSQPAGSTFESGAVAWGWFRNTSYDYLWSLKNGTEINASHGCNSTGTSLRVSANADTGNNRDIQSASQCGNLQTGEQYSTCYYSSGPLNGYCVAINQSCDFIQVYKFDYSSTFPDCANRDYLRNGTLTPDSTEQVYANVWVPYAIPAGDVSNSTLTIEASAA